jgi:hypothetical protein
VRREAGAEWGHNSAPGLFTLDRGRTVRQKEGREHEAECAGRVVARRKPRTVRRVLQEQFSGNAEETVCGVEEAGMYIGVGAILLIILIVLLIIFIF